MFTNYIFIYIYIYLVINCSYNMSTLVYIFIDHFLLLIIYLNVLYVIIYIIHIFWEERLHNCGLYDDVMSNLVISSSLDLFGSFASLHLLFSFTSLRQLGQEARNEIFILYYNGRPLLGLP